MLLYLVRHGQSLWNAEGRHQGWQNVVLSELGEQQAERIGQRLKGVTFDYLYTSPIKRCYDTAAAIVRAQNLELEQVLTVTEALKEARLSAKMEGMLEKDLRKDWTPEEKERFTKDYTFSFPDGESVQSVMARTIAFFNQIAELSEPAPPPPPEEDEQAEIKPENPQGSEEKPKISPKKALLVAHKINVQLLTLHVLNSTEAVARQQNNIDRLEISNCSLTVLEFNLKGKEPFYRANTINDVNHLAGLKMPEPKAKAEGGTH
jgi:broad specificity phosphatase PhoE